MIMLADACAAVNMKPCVRADYLRAALRWSAKATYLSGGGLSGGGLESGGGLSGGGLEGGGGLQVKVLSAEATWCCVSQRHIRH